MEDADAASESGTSSGSSKKSRFSSKSVRIAVSSPSRFSKSPVNELIRMERMSSLAEVLSCDCLEPFWYVRGLNPSSNGEDGVDSGTEKGVSLFSSFELKSIVSCRTLEAQRFWNPVTFVERSNCNVNKDATREKFNDGIVKNGAKFFKSCVRVG